eukprot:COSAG01_NODE_62693_length_283_cov_1.086957_1_plen_63_part_01
MRTAALRASDSVTGIQRSKKLSPLCNTGEQKRLWLQVDGTTVNLPKRESSLELFSRKIAGGSC